MKGFICFILIFSFVKIAEAQSICVIDGTVLDSIDNVPVAGATVQWLNHNGKSESAAETDSKGSFELKINNHSSKGTLQISYVGYTARKFSLNIHKGNQHLNKIYLTPEYHGLKEITVTGKKQTYRIEPDKKVYEVSGNLSAKGGTIEEVFRQVPGVTVTPSGTLSLRNATPTILIDGKRTDLTLEQIPADQIASIEVITNPSSKYDAQGNNGIINIITKKNKKAGLSGNIEGNYTSLPEKTLDGSITYSKRKFSITADYFLHSHREKYTDNLFRNTLTDGTSLRQSSKSETEGPFEMGKLSLDYRMNEHNVFTLSGDYGNGNFKIRNEQTSSYFDTEGVKDESSLRTTHTTDNFHYYHANMDYSHQFTKEGEKIVSSFSFEEYNAPLSGTYQMQYAAPDGRPLGQGLQQYEGGVLAHTVFIQSDYTDPLRGGKAKLEAGFKLNWHYDHNHNLMQDYDSTTKLYVTDKPATYNFYYRDPTYAAYGNYSDKYGWFSFSAGLRFEQYNYRGWLLDSAVTFTYHNPDFFPSLFLTTDVGGGQKLHFNYSRRTNRPAFNEVSPRTNYANPQNLLRGNPHLQSEYTNLAELSYDLQKSTALFSATFYVRNTNHFITTYTTTLSPDTLLTTYANAKYSNTFGGELLYKADISKWWNVTANADFFDTEISASNLDTGLNSEGFSWFAKLSSDIRLPQGMAVQLSGSYEAPKIIPQGKTLSTGSMDISFKKDFLQGKKLSIILSLVDLFNTDRIMQRTYMPVQFNQSYLQKYSTRIFKVSASWSFGNGRN